MSFRLGKIPVRVQPAFFLVTIFLNPNLSPAVLVLWAGVVFVSVLVHELGHASAGLAFGLEPRIDLHGMGGTTSWSTPRTLGTWRNVAISLAGPGAGFALYGVAAAAKAAGLLGATPVGSRLYSDLLYVNLWWGLLNLLPMLPLDGGNVLAQLLGAATKGRGERLARITSIAVAVVGAVVALLLSSWWPALLAVLFVTTNWRGLQALSAREHDAPLRASLEGAYQALDAKDAEKILTLARPVALRSKTAELRAEALQLMAFGFLLSGRVEDADAAIAGLPPGYAPDPSLTALRETAGPRRG